MKTSKIYYQKDVDGRIWCYGYHNGCDWRVFNVKSFINKWFTWYLESPIEIGIFSGHEYILVNNFKEKQNAGIRY